MANLEDILLNRKTQSQTPNIGQRFQNALESLAAHRLGREPNFVGVTNQDDDLSFVEKELLKRQLSEPERELQQKRLQQQIEIADAESKAKIREAQSNLFGSLREAQESVEGTGQEVTDFQRLPDGTVKVKFGRPKSPLVNISGGFDPNSFNVGSKVPKKTPITTQVQPDQSTQTASSQPEFNILTEDELEVTRQELLKEGFTEQEISEELDVIRQEQQLNFLRSVGATDDEIQQILGGDVGLSADEISEAFNEPGIADRILQGEEIF